MFALQQLDCFDLCFVTHHMIRLQHYSPSMKSELMCGAGMILMDDWSMNDTHPTNERLVNLYISIG